VHGLDLAGRKEVKSVPFATFMTLMGCSSIGRAPGC
jgi:hypothetical protein